ncbi:Gfo/Idh/MocA family oxidoreductase [candidate division KSB1 bacterium]|nr:Gfo/Idh/MocA family oxidoreductase [candidate division KSB1 bacterium]
MLKKLNWGLIGCGDIARRRVAPALRDLTQCELVSVNRKDYGKAETFALEFGARKWIREWPELISDPEIDAVYIATPVHLHAEQTIAAVQAGKHILCEKPMALNLRECDAMIEAATANSVTLGVAYYRHFYPVIIRIKNIITRGDMGKIVSIQMNAASHFNALPGEPRYWLLVKEQAGGGPMMDFGCHRIEVLLNLVGPIVKVRSVVNQVSYAREVEDTASALFEFANGAHGSLFVSHAAFEAQDTLAIYGTRGSLHVHNLNRGDLRIVDDNGERLEEHPLPANPHAPLIDDFARAVSAGQNPGVTGHDGREVNVILDKIYHLG